MSNIRNVHEFLSHCHNFKRCYLTYLIHPHQFPQRNHPFQKFFQFNTSQQYSLPSSKPLPCPQIRNLSLLFSTPLKCRINFPFMTSHRGTTPSGPKIRRLQPPLARRSSGQTQVIISPLTGDFQKARWLSGGQLARPAELSPGMTTSWRRSDSSICVGF